MDAVELAPADGVAGVAAGSVVADIAGVTAAAALIFSAATSSSVGHRMLPTSTNSAATDSRYMLVVLLAK